MRILNPFLYGKPVPPSKFVGRSDAVRTIFSRLYNRESTAIVGAPHIGKSSILSYVADYKIRAAWLGERAANYVFAEIDCHMVPRQFSPAEFWSHTLADVPQVVSHDSVTRQWQAMKSSQFGSFTVKRLFQSVDLAGWCVVLVIDEFDVLVNHPNFDGEFFGTLRSLAIGTNLAVITASRIPVAEMNRRCPNPHGSPFFNNLAQVRLISLSPAECRALIDTTLATTEIRFSEADYALIYALSGRHPYLVQVAASALFDVEADGRAESHQAASTLFHDRAAPHFDDVWRHLLPAEQAILLVIALRELKGRLGNEECDTGELGDLRWCEASLRCLHEAGIVDRVDRPRDAADSAPSGEMLWRAASRGFVWWVVDNVITRTRDTIILDSRLHEYESRGILSQGRSREVRHLAASIEPGALTGPTDVCRLLLGEQIKAPAPETLPPKVFISYAWGHTSPNSSEDDRKRQEVVERMCETLGKAGWQVVRDQTDMQYGDLISAFMKTLGQADLIVVVLSDKYLRSPYCMTELHDLYVNSRQEKGDFLKHIIPLVLDDARIGTWRDRAEHAKHWHAEFQAMEKSYQHLGERDFSLYKVMKDWHNHVSDMLAYINDVLTPHGFDEIVKDDFAALRRILSPSTF
ncbi:MAG TPA: TIR domain-containing protein [Terrimicrobiaceae bacterium]